VTAFDQDHQLQCLNPRQWLLRSMRRTVFSWPRHGPAKLAGMATQALDSQFHDSRPLQDSGGGPDGAGLAMIVAANMGRPACFKGIL
jgi:hypothetical protein